MRGVLTRSAVTARLLVVPSNWVQRALGSLLALYMVAPQFSGYIANLVPGASGTRDYSVLLRVLLGGMIACLALGAQKSRRTRIEGWVVICLVLFWSAWLWSWFINQDNIYSTNSFVRNAPLYALADIIFPAMMLYLLNDVSRRSFLMTIMAVSAAQTLAFLVTSRSGVVSVGMTRLAVGYVSAKTPTVAGGLAVAMLLSRASMPSPLNKNRRRWYALAIVFGIAWVALEMISTARASVFGLLTVMLILALLSRRTIALPLMLVAGLTMLLPWASLFDAIGLPLPSLSVERLLDVDTYSLVAGGSDRLLYYRGAWEAFLRSPFIGAGPSPAEMVRYTPAHAPWAHNLFLDALMACGLAGFFPLAVLMLGAVKRAIPMMVRPAEVAQRDLIVIFAYHLCIALVSGGVVNNWVWVTMVAILVWPRAASHSPYARMLRRVRPRQGSRLPAGNEGVDSD